MSISDQDLGRSGRTNVGGQCRSARFGNVALQETNGTVGVPGLFLSISQAICLNETGERSLVVSVGNSMARTIKRRIARLSRLMSIPHLDLEL